MPIWTSEQLRDYERHQADRARLRADQPERDTRSALVGPAKRKGKGCSEPPRRVKITFRIYAVRPLDWDNYRTKDIQDCLIKSGLLAGDDWDCLEGVVISEKAHDQTEEKTEITIEYESQNNH